MLKSKRCGDVAEDELLTHLQSIFGCLAQKNLIHSMRYDYDISVDSEPPVTFEVKHDAMAQKTGNIALEYHNTRKNEPSGFMVTKADLWAHKIGEQIYVCSVKKLKEFVDTEKPHRFIESGGDGNANLLLYKIDQFTKICKPLEELTCLQDFLSLCS